ncbi:esterase family protein [Blastopirellula sp. JC732]|uniref:Esterase family protein n=1 Tax=Blastopirellula sediminis TaxID=2894196 RepID=A0A9X1MNF5_9BACT|nr:alpha/beta hydrolase-fold protein [Blastopirellula sediminis]MCC9606727.1 esterase family protein [Blastopirellula sediminis]MCC9629976.1 esterase family protein [Blastopirellula sediminis]
MIRLAPLALLLVGFASVLFAADSDYELSADSTRKEGVPKGEVIQRTFADSKVFPGTSRDYYLYIPAQYDGKTPAAVMVFQDGHAYVGENGQFRAPAVMDNLIAEGAMPVTIGIFLNPGHKGESKIESPWRSNNRSFEYDTLSGDYATFVIDEILPSIAKEYQLTDNPNLRAICGISSGGICAFTVAWERPDQFHKVMSHVGSFTNIRGGNVYPALIRKTEPKPLRIFLQDGENDVDNEHGNWWLSNLQMEKALAYKKYDYKFVGGTGEHSGVHGGAILPESLRWLWRGWQEEKVVSRFQETP